MVNSVTLIGNLGRDPEARNSAGGTSVCNLRIATTSRRKNRDGTWGDHTEWHTVVAFGKTADNAIAYLSKGRQVYVEGRLQTRKWQDKEGRDRWSTEVVANNIRFLGSKGDNATGGGNHRPRPASYQPEPFPALRPDGTAPDVRVEFPEADIPF